jgi:hypothetical protein
MRKPQCLVVAALITLVLSGAGCARNGNRAAVSGTVLIDHEPVAEGSINFRPVDGNAGPSTGAVIEDGVYTIPREHGATIGKNRIEIRAFKKSGRKVPDPMARTPGQLTDEVVPAIPPEHATHVREIVAGDNTVDFDLPGTSARKK